MHKIIALIFTSLSLFTFGQIQNSNTINSEVPKAEMEEIEQLDSIAVDSKELYKSHESTTKAKVAEKKGAKALKDSNVKETEGGQPPVPAAPVSDQAVQSQEYQKASYGFSYTKQQVGTQRSQRSPNEEQQKQMDEAVSYFETTSPNTFECNYYKYLAGNYNTDLVEYLEKAEEIRPENTDVQVQMAAYHMITGNIQQGISYIDKLIAAKRLDATVLDYSKDLLVSAPGNGMLITHGFDDSYGTWYVQNKQKIREDVRLVSLDFMQSQTYREDLEADGYNVPTRQEVDVEFLEEFCVANSDKEISISLTTPKEYFEPIKRNLYVTGLTFEYSEEAIDNYGRNEELWNSQLEKHLVTDATDEKSKKLSANYLPMLLQLRKVYLVNGQEDKVKTIDDAIDKLSAQSNKYEQVQKLKKTY